MNIQKPVSPTGQAILAVDLNGVRDMIDPSPCKATVRKHLIDSGLITPRKLGQKTVYLVSEVQEALSKLPFGENAVLHDADADTVKNKAETGDV